MSISLLAWISDSVFYGSEIVSEPCINDLVQPSGKCFVGHILLSHLSGSQDFTGVKPNQHSIDLRWWKRNRVFLWLHPFPVLELSSHSSHSLQIRLLSPERQRDSAGELVKDKVISYCFGGMKLMIKMPAVWCLVRTVPCFWNDALYAPGKGQRSERKKLCSHTAKWWKGWPIPPSPLINC